MKIKDHAHSGIVDNRLQRDLLARGKFCFEWAYEKEFNDCCEAYRLLFKRDLCEDMEEKK